MTFPWERASRLIVLASIVAAGAAHAFFTSQTLPAASWAAAVAFVVSFALARVSLPLALMPALLTAYLAPAVLLVAFNAPDPHVFVWLALLAGPIVAASDWSRWHAPRSWTPLLAGWAMVVALSWPVIAGREIDFSLAAARTLNTPSGLNAGPPPIAAAAVTAAALAHLLAISWFDLLWSRFGADRVARAERSLLAVMVVSSAIGSVAALYQRYVDLEWLAHEQFAQVNRASGLMLDGNSFGMAAAIWAPLAVVVFRRMGRPLIGTAFCALLLAGVWATGSRTAFLTAIAGLSAVIVTTLRSTGGWRSRIVPLGALAGVVLVLAMAFAVGDRSNPLARISELGLDVENRNIGGVARALWNRQGYGVTAGRAIAAYPWTGVGIGAFNQLSSDFSYLGLGAVLLPDNAQNWWRQQLAELGMIGAIPSVLLSVLVVVALCRRTAAPDRRNDAAILRTSIVGIGLASLVGVPTQHPALLLTVATLLYWLGALIDRSTIATATTLQRAAWAAAFVLPLVVIGGQWRSATGDLRVPHRALRLGFPYAYGFTAYEADNVPWSGRHAVAVLFAQHAYFALTADPSHIGQPVRVRMWRENDSIVDVESDGQKPIVRIIRVPEGRRFLMLEIEISRVAPDGRGLRLTSEWLREVPPQTPPALVVP